MRGAEGYDAVDPVAFSAGEKRRSIASARRLLRLVAVGEQRSQKPNRCAAEAVTDKIYLNALTAVFLIAPVLNHRAV